MTDQQQHRATPEDWEYIRLRAEDGVGLLNCILELRARVEALEATQQIRVFSAEEVAPIVVTTTEARPAGLVGRVAQAMGPSSQIREVAAWLSEHTDDDAAAYWAARLEQEADRG